MIFRELIGGKCLCDATDIINWYIVYVGPLVKVPKDTGLVLPLGMSPKKHRVKDTGYELPLGDVPE